ncbi:hypothetical protein [Pectobacterium polaris]|uniref:hypothetical protein n=1 Tax=Pectobacterium polaris TaxID=2042057 RepID=UPI0021C83090|nr:hypothetical protein [Pectobacterium polaris]MCU1795227.1 hypothetical protein [Pectobacterium polaris]
MAKKKNDEGAAIVFLIIGALVFIPFIFLIYLHYRKMKSRYLTNRNVQRVVDTGRFYTVLCSGLACVVGMLVVLWVGSANIGYRLADVTYGPMLISTLMVLYILLMLYPFKKLADAAATAYLGVILEDDCSTLIFPADLANCTVSDVVKLRFLKGLGTVERFQYSQITSFTREKGKFFYIHGDFGSRALSFSNKQKRDECLAALQQRIKFRGTRDLGY